MKLRNLYSWLPLVAILLGVTNTFAQAPTNNPYREVFENRISGKHWTDSLPWYKVVEAKNVAGLLKPGARANTYLVDSARLHVIFDSISNQMGGGVLYFAPDTYDFSFGVNLRSKVIIRGGTPSQIHATWDNFNPPTYFRFPVYSPSFTGSGRANSTAFKKIARVGQQSVNMGLVNLNINRAGIVIHPNYIASKFNISATDPNSAKSFWPDTLNPSRNVIVMGVRSNNVATPESGVPATTAAVPQSAWQRFSWRFECNIDVTVSENLVVNNNRLNDIDGYFTASGYVRLGFNSAFKIQSDNYRQQGYVVINGNQTGAKTVSDADNARFDYTAHYAMGINRFKRISATDAETRGFIESNTPTNEPMLYSRGVEIRNNWIFNTARSALQTSGNGTFIEFNVFKDMPLTGIRGTSTVNLDKRTSLDPTGKSGVESATISTFENRGIDFNGRYANIAFNKIERRRHNFIHWNTGQATGKRSGDGEGIVMQRPTGGPNFQIGHTIIGNEFLTPIKLGTCPDCGTSSDQTPIDIGKRGDPIGVGVGNIYFVSVLDNKFNGNDMFLIANLKSTGGDPAPRFLSGIMVRNNTGLRSLSVNGIRGGAPGFVIDNFGWTAPDANPRIGRPCHISLNPDYNQKETNTNTGFSVEPCSNSEFLLGTATINKPSVDTMISSATAPAPGTNIALNVNITGNYRPVTRVDIYKDTMLVASQTGSDLANGSYPANIVVNVPQASGNITHVYSARVTFQDSLLGFSNGRRITTCYGSGCVTSAPEVIASATKTGLLVYPNPARNEVYFELEGKQLGNYNLQLFDNAGKLVLSREVVKSAELFGQQINLSGVKPGLYHLSLMGNGERLNRVLVIE